MSKPAFTPGPWQTDAECGDESVLGPDGAMVADCAIFGMRVNRTEHINRANARLIAAAPDMYEALLAAKVVIEMMERPEGMGGRVNAALDKRLAQIDAAIAKAEGMSA